MSLTQEQINALHELANGEPVQVFPNKIAKPLIDGGYVNVADIDPAPKNGTGINLNSVGRGALIGTAPVSGLPAESAGTDA